MRSYCADVQTRGCGEPVAEETGSAFARTGNAVDPFHVNGF